MQESLLQKERGNEYFNAGKYEDAIACYSTAIKLCDLSEEKTLSIIYSNRAFANLMLERYYTAIDDASLSFLLDKNYYKPLVHRYEARKSLGQLTEALVDITAVCVLQKEKNKVNVARREELLICLNLAKRNELMPDFPKINIFDALINEYFGTFKNHALFDVSYGAQKLHEFLLRLKNNEHEVENRNAKIDLTEATICFLNGDGELAENFARKSLLKVKNDTKLRITAMIQLANALMIQPSHYLPVQILQLFNSMIILDENNVDIYMHRAIFYFKLKLRLEGFVELQRCIDLEPTFEAPYLHRFAEKYNEALECNRGDLHEILKEIKEYIRNHPNSDEAVIQYSYFHYNIGNYEKAAEIVSEALRDSPNNAKFLHGLSRILLAIDRKAAQPYLLKSINIASSYQINDILMLASLVADDGNLKAALTYIDKAMLCFKTDLNFEVCNYFRELFSSRLNACKLLEIDSIKANFLPAANVFKDFGNMFNFHIANLIGVEKLFSRLSLRFENGGGFM